MKKVEKMILDIIDTPILISWKTGKHISVVRRYLKMKYKMSVEESVLCSRLNKLKND
jgi:hypothetical protein